MRRLLWLAPWLLSAEVRILTDFPNASLGPVKQVSPLHFRIGVKGQADQDGRNRQANWYSFRVSGVPRGAEVRIDLVDLPGEYNYQPNRGAVTKDTRPYWKDGSAGSWQEASGEYDPDEPRWRLQFRPNKSEFHVAHLPPYTQANLQALRKGTRPKVEQVGRSVSGRPIELWTFDLSGGKLGAPVAWLMLRQHAWEAGTSWAGEGLLRNLGPGIVWKVLPWCDPDGVAEGGVRFNRHGFDLNRNWDAPIDPTLRPEILAQRKAIEDWLKRGNKINFFLTLHNTETGEYLEGPPDSPLGQRLYSNLKQETLFDPDRPYFSRMAVDRPGRANVIQWLWGTHRVPAFLMELRIAISPRRQARPTPESWREFGKQLAGQVTATLLAK
jgi:hypothetical protein